MSLLLLSIEVLLFFVKETCWSEKKRKLGLQQSFTICILFVPTIIHKKSFNGDMSTNKFSF